MRSCPPQYPRSCTPVNPSPSLFFVSFFPCFFSFPPFLSFSCSKSKNMTTLSNTTFQTHTPSALVFCSYVSWLWCLMRGYQKMCIWKHMTSHYHRHSMMKTTRLKFRIMYGSSICTHAEASKNNPRHGELWWGPFACSHIELLANSSQLRLWRRDQNLVRKGGSIRSDATTTLATICFFVCSSGWLVETGTCWYRTCGCGQV